MVYAIKKVNNCFVDAETYEYSIGCSAQSMLEIFSSIGEFKVNNRLRRPVFNLDLPDGTNVKGVLSEPVLRTSFHSLEAKADFELWLSGLEAKS